VLGCGGVTTENGRAPPDLLPSIRWFPDADDLTFSILYGTEDAYENPLSQLKFHGATMHVATVQEFLAFQEAAKTKSIVPVHGRPILPLRPGERSPFTRPEIEAMGGKTPDLPLQPGELERLTHAEIEALGGKAPKPNWLQELQCDAVGKYELSEVSREIVRRYWPADKPRYWVPDGDAFDTIWKEIHRGVPKDPANPAGEYFRRQPLTKNESTYDYAWSYAEPATDGLPTRTGGGALQERDDSGRARMRNPPYKPPILYPVQYGATLPFYQTQDKNPESPLWARIDMRGGATKGFAYCQVKLPWFDLDAKESWRSAERLLPGFRQRSRQTYIDDQLIATQLSPGGGGSALTTAPPIFERDQFMFMKASAYH
jgi:hypothetical protein